MTWIWRRASTHTIAAHYRFGPVTQDLCNLSDYYAGSIACRKRLCGVQSNHAGPAHALRDKESESLSGVCKRRACSARPLCIAVVVAQVRFRQKTLHVRSVRAQVGGLQPFLFAKQAVERIVTGRVSRTRSVMTDETQWLANIPEIGVHGFAFSHAEHGASPEASDHAFVKPLFEDVFIAGMQ